MRPMVLMSLVAAMAVSSSSADDAKSQPANMIVPMRTIMRHEDVDTDVAIVPLEALEMRRSPAASAARDGKRTNKKRTKKDEGNGGGDDARKRDDGKKKKKTTTTNKKKKRTSGGGGGRNRGGGGGGGSSRGRKKKYTDGITSAVDEDKRAEVDATALIGDNGKAGGEDGDEKRAKEGEADDVVGKSSNKHDRFGSTMERERAKKGHTSTAEGAIDASSLINDNVGMGSGGIEKEERQSSHHKAKSTKPSWGQYYSDDTE
jgi:hypothetical protein